MLKPIKTGIIEIHILKTGLDLHKD